MNNCHGGHGGRDTFQLWGVSFSISKINCRFWTFIQGVSAKSCNMIFQKNCNISSQKWGGGGGIKGRLEFFWKFIRFGGAICPLEECRLLKLYHKGGAFASVILATKRSGVFVGRCKPHRRWEIKEHVLHVHKYHITFSAVICMSYIMWTYFAQVEQRLEGGAEGRRCERTQDCNVVDINLVCE